ncbi:hypothetical protein CBQ26_00815 [Deinococcus indicus]|uniref:Uncharacterized protein n=1 Tax=Deinococcus indicus TaxID=223556 RepID=A0A246BTL9_9DEIO|nr:zinc finger-like domain-containing protein [Deinococcus indicus]OWL99034.1 hypothetical protein CBQ26_00815 [Deinococcus indicus]
MTGPLEQIDALLGQMRRDLPNTDACLPNLAGDTLRAKAAVIQGYIDVLEPAVLALRAQAGAEQDTPESVNEAVRAANNTTGRPRPLPKEEDDARFDVIQLGRAYGLALKAAAELPEVRIAFRDAQARLAAALAQTSAGGEGCKRCNGIGMASSARDAEGLWIPETCPECRGRGSTRARAQADAGGEG